MKHAAFLLGLGLAACASAAPAGGWSMQSWNAQPPRQVSGGPFGFSASPYGDDGFKLKLTIRMNAVGASAATGAPEEAQLMAAAQAAAPEGCTVKSVTRSADGGAVADYDCAG